MSNHNKPAHEFEEKTKIVYPLQGVGIIEKIEKRKFNNKSVRYYRIYMETLDMRVMAPIEKSKELGLRRLVSKKVAASVLEGVSKDKDFPGSGDYKLRYQYGMQKIKTGSFADVASVLKTLFLRSQTKDLPIMERKLYDLTLISMITELSIVLDKPVEEIKEQLLGVFRR